MERTVYGGGVEAAYVQGYVEASRCHAFETLVASLMVSPRIAEGCFSLASGWKHVRESHHCQLGNAWVACAASGFRVLGWARSLHENPFKDLT